MRIGAQRSESSYSLKGCDISAWGNVPGKEHHPNLTLKFSYSLKGCDTSSRGNVPGKEHHPNLTLKG
jgi:hypothetical protein